MTHEQADNTLADAIWWFRGHSAAQPVDAYDRTYDLAGALLTARNWLKRLSLGRTRMVGLSERHLGMVLAEYEAEVIYDGLRAGADAEERENARKALKKAFDEFNSERREAVNGGGLPF